MLQMFNLSVENIDSVDFHGVYGKNHYELINGKFFLSKNIL